MKKIIAVSAALLLSTTAHAQILGGGAVGGVGGTLNGTIGGAIGGATSNGGTLDSVRSGTSGTLRGATSSTGSQSVDRRKGRVKAERSVSADGGGDVTSSLTGPLNSVTSSASGSGNVTGSGSADAQLIGTDAARNTLRGATSGTVQRARDIAGSAQGQGQGLISGASGVLNAAGSGSGSASGSAGGASGPLSGSAAGSGSGDGAFSVTSGMPILSPDGARIGRVQRVLSNARGEAEQLLVKVDGRLATLPAANFSASGNALTSAMTESQIKQIGSQQEAANAR
jgi:hypothetical protein